MKNGRNQWISAAFRAAAGAAALTAALALTPVRAADPAASLFDAIRANDLARVKQLIESGADPRQRSADGVSAPQAAVRLGHNVIAHYLLTRPRSEKVPDFALPPPEETARAPDAPANAIAQTPVPAPAPLSDAPKPAIDAVTPPPAAEPALKKGMLARAADWIDGLFGDKETAKPADPTQPKTAAAEPRALTQPADTSPPPAAGAAPAPKVAGIPAPKTPRRPTDADAIATAANPNMQPAERDLPEADLPRALAQAPASDDPLGKALAIPDDGTKCASKPAGDPLADLSILDGDAKPKAKAAADSENQPDAPAVPDLTKMTPVERLAWLDQLLKRTVDRDGGKSLADSRREAFGHLRDRAAKKDADDARKAAAAPPPATPAEILKVLPAGSQVKLDLEGRPILPGLWTEPVVLTGQQPPLKDLARAYVTPAGFRAGLDRSKSDTLMGAGPPGANSAGAWTVTKIEMADGKSVQPPPAGQGGEPLPPSAAGQNAALENVTLSIGTGTNLYNTFIPANAKGGEGRAPECIEKSGGRTQVCITELSWPAFLEPKFLVSTILYTGTGAVVRFDDGSPTRMQVVYQADAFDEITDWMVRRFGPPSQAVNRSISPFGQPRRDNTSTIWRALDRVTQKPVMLEVRKYDDTRDGFPDIRNGVIMLYREGAPGIFPQVSVHELMRLKPTG
ncbi:MAG: hypothetical protein VW268_05570 [Rhodospirillaceae bacterium]